MRDALLLKLLSYRKQNVRSSDSLKNWWSWFFMLLICLDRLSRSLYAYVHHLIEHCRCFENEYMSNCRSSAIVIEYFIFFNSQMRRSSNTVNQTYFESKLRMIFSKMTMRVYKSFTSLLSTSFDSRSIEWVIWHWIVLTTIINEVQILELWIHSHIS